MLVGESRIISRCTASSSTTRMRLGRGLRTSPDRAADNGGGAAASSSLSASSGGTTRFTSSGIVRPRAALAMPSWNMLFMPLARAARRTTSSEARVRSTLRTRGVKRISS